MPLLKQSFAPKARPWFWLWAMTVACGGSHPAATIARPTSPTASTRPQAPPPAPRAVRERIAPHMCAARTRLAQLLGHTTPPPAPPSEQSPQSAPAPSTSLAGATRIAGNQAYRVVAPATVLTTSERSMGSGVVIDPKGYVLTNYHVVADGRKQDFVGAAAEAVEHAQMRSTPEAPRTD